MPKIASTTTESVDNYLKAVFELTALHERATTSEISRKLNVSAASVTGMLKRLAGTDPSLVTYTKHFGVELTEAGAKRAVEVIRHHRLIETYLHEALGYRWDEVHQEAERLEHFISEDLEDRMAAKLGYPEYDPHGHPIPRRDGTIPPCEDIPMRVACRGCHVRVNRVADEDPGFLQRLTSLGIGLHQEFEILEPKADDGSMRFRFRSGAEQTVDAEVIAGVRVRIVRETAIQPEGGAVDRWLGRGRAIEAIGEERSSGTQ